MIPREVSDSPQGILPRHPGVRVIQGCRGELILQFRDDLSNREIQRAFEAIPLLANIRFDNPLLRMRRASVPALDEPDAAAVAILFDPTRANTCSSNGPLAMDHSLMQAGLWDYTTTGWEAADERGFRNNFPDRYLPTSCRGAAERRGPRRAGRLRSVATDVAPSAIRSLSDYRSFLAELDTLARQEKRCEEHQEELYGNSRRATENIEIDAENEAIAQLTSNEGAAESGEESSNCPQGSQIQQRLAGLRNRLTLQEALRYEGNIADDVSLPMHRRLAARWRQQTYRDSWTREQSDSNEEQLNSTKLETLRFCAARGYCECERNGFYRQVTLEMVIGTEPVDADGARANFTPPEGLSEPQQQEYIRFRRQLELSRNNFIRRNSISPDDEESLLRLCSSNAPDVIIERFESEE